MNYSRPLHVLFPVVLIFGFVTGAFAQASRTWVSGVGDDVNPCSRTAPCKTFAGAISKTQEGGEISVLDPGGYGSLTIVKAITVDGGTGAGYGHVLASNTSGFTVNVTTGTHVNAAVVILRNLTVNGIKQSPSLPGTHGVNYIKAAQLRIENCVFENLTLTGINANMTTAGALFVRDCYIDNTTAGIKATSTVQSVFVDVKNVSVHGQTDGINFNGGASGTVTDSFFTRIIGGSAISAASGAFVNVTRCHLRSNTNAINASAGSTVRINDNEIFDNTNGLAGTAASFQSGGNNKLAGNGASVAPTGPALTTQ